MARLSPSDTETLASAAPALFRLAEQLARS
jgi:hypothetical protein